MPAAHSWHQWKAPDRLLAGEHEGKGRGVGMAVSPKVVHLAGPADN